MPKASLNDTYYADKNNCTSGGNSSSSSSSSLLTNSRKSTRVSKPLYKLAKTKLTAKGNVLKICSPPFSTAIADHGKKVKSKKIFPKFQKLLLKTRICGAKKEVNADCKGKMREQRKSSPVDDKVKVKEETKTKVKSKEIKKTNILAASHSVVMKKEVVKKSKAECKTILVENKTGVGKNTSSGTNSTNPLPPKKELKKRKEISDAAGEKDCKKSIKAIKKDEHVDSQTIKKETQNSLEKEAKVTKITEMDEKCIAPKKRLKQKCTNETSIAATHLNKESLSENKELANAVKLQPQPKNIKFFKSKSRKGEKSKEVVTSTVKTNDALSVYDKIDEDSDDFIKQIKSKSVNHLNKVSRMEAKLKTNLELTKSKATTEKCDKRKLTYLDSETEMAKKKVKLDVPSKTFKAKKSIVKTPEVIKKDQEWMSSSDDAPLNRLVALKKGKTQTAFLASKRVQVKSDFTIKSGGSETEANSTKKTKLKSSSPARIAKQKAKMQPCDTKSIGNEDKKSSESKNRKSVHFSKSIPSKAIVDTKPAVRKRCQRMASLNALAMVHCMYENEGKSVSISSFESTEVSDDNFKSPKRSQSEGKQVVEKKGVLMGKKVVKFEPKSNSADPVINRECLRSAPGVRSVGKHWDMNSSSISSDMDQKVAKVTQQQQPIVIKEMKVLEKPRNCLRKKFGRNLRRQVSEDSSEEDKHQVLLHEEKQRMIRRRRRQRKEITMDLKDMVVRKRMASLNATAILAASYSSTTGKKTFIVKSAGKEKKGENVEDIEKTESLISNVKGRKFPPMKKQFCSSSDADVEDEADGSGSEVVVKTASSSGKQQVSLILNQDSGVTITGLYLNSTTKSTHRQGFCSISGMQYRISSTSHTQTEATTVSTEPIVRTPQEPLRPPITVSLHGERQPSPQRPAIPVAHASPVKTYTPLGALSNMHPPDSPHHVHHLHHHPKTMALSSTQEISSLERHGCPSAFSTPTLYGPPSVPPTLATVAAPPPYPIISKTPPKPAFVAGYYQPAGPLISHHHHHHHHHHHVQQPANSTTTTTTSTAGGPAAIASPASATTIATSFTKVPHHSPLVQPPTPPASNVTQPVSETSDNEMASSATPAVEIAISENPPVEEPNYEGYRFAGSANPPASFRSPSHTYQNYYPTPPSTASLPLPQQQAHFQEVLYGANPSPGPPTAYHLGYLQSKGPPYHPPVSNHPSMPGRYIPAIPPQQYYHHEYTATAPVSQQQGAVSAHHSLTSTADSYHSAAPPAPSIIESYQPPPLPPPIYYSRYGTPAPYYPYGANSRGLTLVETNCPCPIQGCQKNVHTGPLTGIISKGPVKQRNAPLSPVALSLPKEPHDIRSLPSPATGSAGSRPTSSPAIATAKHPPSWNEGSDNGSDTAGLLTISKISHDSMVDVDSGIDGSTETSPIKTKRSKCNIREHKKSKVGKIRKTHHNGKYELKKIHSTFCRQMGDANAVEVLSVSPFTELVSRLKFTNSEVEANSDICNSMEEEQMDELTAEEECCKGWSGDESSEPEMPLLYPEVSPPSCKRFGYSLLDDELLVKRAKLSDEANFSDAISLVDMEKNNYLSALELRSVSSGDNRLDGKPSEELAPLRRYDESPLKIAANSSASQEHPNKAKYDDNSVSVTWPACGHGSLALVSSVSNEGITNAVESKKPRFRRRRWTTKKKNKKSSNKSSKCSTEEEKQESEDAERRRRVELLSLSQKHAASRLRWSNGWNWLGEPYVAKVFLNTEGTEVLRTCYLAMKHRSGDIIRSKDCILLRSGCKKTDLPYIAKVAHLWEDPDDGEMMMSLFWYYRREHTEHDSTHGESPYELYASKHKDVNSVACIEDKCYVLTFNEYCRYHKSIRQTEESVDISSGIVPPLTNKRYPRQGLLPPKNTLLDLVFFCRKIYDFRQHRLLKNPFFV